MYSPEKCNEDNIKQAKGVANEGRPPSGSNDPKNLIPLNITNSSSETNSCASSYFGNGDHPSHNSGLGIQSDSYCSDTTTTSFTKSDVDEKFPGLRKKVLAAYKNLPPRQFLYKFARRMLERRESPDTVIVFPTETVYCHKIVLNRYSEKFRRVECIGRAVYLDSKVSCDTFKWIYGWMLKDGIDIPIENIIKIFIAAKYLKIKELLAECWFVFDSGRLIAEDLAFSLYVEAHQYREKQISLPMLSRISKYFLFAVATSHFLQMDIDDVQAMFKLNALGVNTEIEVFMSAVCWLMYDWPKREQHVAAAMRYVRFSLIAPWYLTGLRESKDWPELRVIVENPSVSEKIIQGLTFTTGLIYFHKFPERFADFRRNNNLEPTVGRQWIYDELCPYHYLDKYPRLVLLTYDDFIKYLTLLRGKDSDYWKSVKSINEYGDFRWLLACKKPNPHNPIHRNPTVWNVAD